MKPLLHIYLAEKRIYPCKNYGTGDPELGANDDHALDTDYIYSRGYVEWLEYYDWCPECLSHPDATLAVLGAVGI
jgi:hypothetical protein